MQENQRESVTKSEKKNSIQICIRKNGLDESSRQLAETVGKKWYKNGGYTPSYTIRNAQDLTEDSALEIFRNSADVGLALNALYDHHRQKLFFLTRNEDGSYHLELNDYGKELFESGGMRDFTKKRTRKEREEAQSEAEPCCQSDLTFEKKEDDFEKKEDDKPETVENPIISDPRSKEAAQLKGCMVEISPNYTFPTGTYVRLTAINLKESFPFRGSDGSGRNILGSSIRRIRKIEIPYDLSKADVRKALRGIWIVNKDTDNEIMITSFEKKTAECYFVNGHISAQDLLKDWKRCDDNSILGTVINPEIEEDGEDGHDF